METLTDKDLGELEVMLDHFLQGIVYEYGRGQQHSKHYTKTSYGDSFATDDFCKEKAGMLAQIISRYYIKKSEVEEAIGKDESDPNRNARWQAYRNELRQELRNELGLDE